jgi:hypothetical protein
MKDNRSNIKAFISCLDNNQFYQAHEIMEDVWRKLKKQNHKDTNLYKGFVNGATCFELLRLGRVNAAQHTWTTYNKYLVLLDKNVSEFELLSQASNKLKALYKSSILNQQ